MLWISGTGSYRVRSLMLRAWSTVSYALWAGVGLTILTERDVRTIRTAQFHECTYFNRRLRSRTYEALGRGIKFQIVVQSAPESCINLLLFQQHQTLDIRLDNPGARTPISSTFPGDLNGWYCTPVSVVAQRWYRTLQYRCIWWLLVVFHISPKPLPPGAVIRSRPFLPDARVFSSVAGGVHFVPFLSSGADGVRESACHHVSPFGTSNHPIIRRLTMELGGGHYSTKAAATQGTCIPR